jgi:hypothetical protein
MTETEELLDSNDRRHHTLIEPRDKGKQGQVVELCIWQTS